MDKFGWRAVWGLCLLQLSLAQIGECPPGSGREWPERSGPTRPPRSLSWPWGTEPRGACGLDLVKES